MKNETQKVLRASRRGMAFVIAGALCLSTLATASPAEAAALTKPKLAVKKKTLYYNKTGKKTYTLKVKSNKVKKIVSTTWKTSKKSVVSLTKKKKLSVKLTAKKKGTSTVTATVQYVPKGKWMVRTISLKCKVTSKKAATSKKTSSSTPAPVNSATPTPTNIPDMPSSPTDVSVSQQPASVELDQSEVVFGSTEEGENTKTLTAVVKDAQGKELKGQDISWSTDNDSVAEVEDGVITAKEEGTANITASVGKIESDPCAVIVDTTAPTIEGVRISDYKNIVVYFDEAVKGDPEVSVTRSSEDSDDVTVRMTPALASNGQSMTLVSASALKEGTYNLDISGLTDYAGNKLASGTQTVTKAASRPEKFICTTEEIPAGQDEVIVYFKIVDQYGEEMRDYTIGDLSATAATESGMPLDISVDGEKYCVKISGAIGSVAIGKKVYITLSSKSLGVSGEFTTTLVDPAGVGTASKIDRVSAASENMDNSGDSETPQFTLTTDEKQNVFSLTTELLDKFGSPASSKVVYAINGGTDIIEFVDTEGSNSKSTNICDSDTPVSVKAKKKGVVTITAYLASDDSQHKDITITILPTALQKITVGELASGYNMQESQAKITLDPIGTGITASDLTYEPINETSKERIEEIQFTDASDGSGEIYVSVKAAADSKDDPIQFFVCYMEGGQKVVTSNVVTYNSSPMPLVDKIKIDDFKETVCVDKEVTTSYQLLNRYGENITNIATGPLTATATTASVGTLSSLSAAEGVLSIEGKSVGDTSITLKYENISETISVTVKDTAVVTKMCFTEKNNGEDWEIIGTVGKSIYIPVSFLDQYGKEITETADNWSSYYDIHIATDAGCYTLSPSDANGNTLSGSDVIEYIKIEMKGIPVSKVLTLSVTNSSNENFVSNTLTVYIRPECEASELRIEKDSQAVISGTATVTNKVTVVDQYKQEFSLPSSQKVLVKVTQGSRDVTDVFNAVRTITTTNVSGSDYSIPIYIDSSIPSGTYIVTAYIGENVDPLKSDSIQKSYTLKIGTIKELADRIEIDKTIIDASNYEINISDVDFIKIAGNEENLDDYTYNLGYKLYDKEGTEIENAATSVPSGSIGWSVSGTDISAKVENDGSNNQLTAQFESSADVGVITVTAVYQPGGIEDGVLTIPVSCKASEIKAGTYAIEDENGDEIALEATQNISKSAITYTLYGKDQYGEKAYLDTSVYSVYAQDTSVANVAVGSTKGTFTVMQTSEAENGAETIVIVKATSKETGLIMKVKASSSDGGSGA